MYDIRRVRVVDDCSCWQSLQSSTPTASLQIRAVHTRRIYHSLGPFHGATAVPSVTRCRCRGHRCAGGARQYRWRDLVNGREAARSSERAQHFSNASCYIYCNSKCIHVHDKYKSATKHAQQVHIRRPLDLYCRQSNYFRVKAYLFDVFVYQISSRELMDLSLIHI